MSGPVRAIETSGPGALEAIVVRRTTRPSGRKNADDTVFALHAVGGGRDLRLLTVERHATAAEIADHITALAGVPVSDRSSRSGVASRRPAGGAGERDRPSALAAAAYEPDRGGDVAPAAVAQEDEAAVFAARLAQLPPAPPAGERVRFGRTDRWLVATCREDQPSLAAGTLLLALPVLAAVAGVAVKSKGGAWRHLAGWLLTGVLAWPLACRLGRRQRVAANPRCLVVDRLAPPLATGRNHAALAGCVVVLFVSLDRLAPAVAVTLAATLVAIVTLLSRRAYHQPWPKLPADWEPTPRPGTRQTAIPAEEIVRIARCRDVQHWQGVATARDSGFETYRAVLVRTPTTAVTVGPFLAAAEETHLLETLRTMLTGRPSAPSATAATDGETP